MTGNRWGMSVGGTTSLLTEVEGTLAERLRGEDRSGLRTDGEGR